MAEAKSFSRYNMCCGLVLKAKTCNVRLTGFDIPELDQRFLILTGKDIHDENFISALGGRMPLLAEDKIDYIGQPLLVLFGPDYESTELVLQEIKVNTEPIAEEEKKDDSSHADNLIFSWGQDDLPDDTEKTKLKKIESTYSFDHTIYFSPLRYRITVWQTGSVMHVQTPMQWPELIRKSVANATHQDPKSIQLHNIEYYSQHDEYLFEPAIYASLASIAAVRTSLPAEIRMITESAKPGVVVKKTTYINDDNHPVLEEALMSVDQGAYAFASEELERQAMTGLIPVYSVKSFRAEIEIKTSNKLPASFCGSLGYSEALAASEFHLARISDRTEYTPTQLKDTIITEKTRFTDYAPSFNLEDREKVKSIIKDSVFNRKWASNNFQRGEFGLLGSLRGIGIAGGSGIAGFSSTLSKQQDFSALMIYTAKKSIAVNTSAHYSQIDAKLWKSLIESKFKEPPDGIVFLDTNGDNIDSGPDVLSRFITKFTPQIGIAAKQLSTLLGKNKPPITLKFDVENKYSPCEFEHAGYGSVIVEIKIDNNDFRPIAKEVWASFALANIISSNDVRDKARRTILNTLEECGIERTSSFKLHMQFFQKNEETDNLASVASIARALTIGAIISALYQAAGPKAAMLPTSAEKLERITKGDSL